MLKRLVYIVLMLVCALGAQAASYTVGEVPNVQRQDSTQYVSNPDGILSAAAVSALNAELRQLRHRTTAEAMVVVLDGIDGGDIDTFATELFEEWGLGKDDVDNGLLVLVVKDLRRAAIRPGYGLEGVLPDIVCGTILREYMFPAFREGDYSAGVQAAVAEICRVLTDPDAAAEIRSKAEDYNAAHADDDDSQAFYIYLIICGIVAAGMLLWLLALLWNTRGLDLHARYVELAKYRALFLAISFLGLGMPLIAALPLVILLQYWRNKPRVCKNCGKKMTKLDEVTDNQYLDPGQDLEERLGSVDYDVWLCPDCGETDIEPYVNATSSYQVCPRCGVRAYALRRQRIVRPATTRQEGLGVNEYHCSACGYDHDENFRIEKKADNSAAAGAVLGAVLGSAAGRGGGGFSGGGGFGGGGFGGGHTGGGGASGGW